MLFLSLAAYTDDIGNYHSRSGRPTEWDLMKKQTCATVGYVTCGGEFMNIIHQYSKCSTAKTIKWITYAKHQPWSIKPPTKPDTVLLPKRVSTIMSLWSQHTNHLLAQSDNDSKQQAKCPILMATSTHLTLNSVHSTQGINKRIDTQYSHYTVKATHVQLSHSWHSSQVTDHHRVNVVHCWPSADKSLVC